MATSKNKCLRRSSNEYTLAFKSSVVDLIENYEASAVTTIPKPKETPAHIITCIARELQVEKIQNKVLNGMMYFMSKE